MVNAAVGYGFCMFCAIVVILGDYYIKRAADDALSLTSNLFLAGSALYLVSAGMWYFAMRHITLAQAGVAYSMLTLVALCVIGAVVFGEELRMREYVGIGFAVLAMLLMTRVL